MFQNVANSTTEIATLVANVTANYDKLSPADIAASSSVVDQLTIGAIANAEVCYYDNSILSIYIYILDSNVNYLLVITAFYIKLN